MGIFELTYGRSFKDSDRGMGFFAMGILKLVVSKSMRIEAAESVCQLLIETFNGVVNLNIDYLLEDLRMVNSEYL